MGDAFLASASPDVAVRMGPAASTLPGWTLTTPLPLGHLQVVGTDERVGPGPRPSRPIGFLNPRPRASPFFLSFVQVVETDERVAAIHANSESFDSKAETSFKYLQVRASGCEQAVNRL